jgi:type 1 glutamine amidotransferase
MLVYNRTLGFPHDSIPAGVAMLEQIAAENEITVTVTNTNELITPEGLASFEIVFFMNSTGDIFNNTEQQVFEDWMTSETGGAFAGTHSATDTERGWAFYSEVTGQYYDGHGSVEEGIIQWEPDALAHPTVAGLPNPWNRREEWYKFTSANWEGKEGFQILSRITNNDGGTRPVSYVREFSNFRSFYTSIGHESVAFQDADVKKHVTAGILWAVRREAQIP